MPVEVGQEAPDFTLKNQAGEHVTLSSFRGAKNVVLMFYPLAFSGVCTRQFTDISAHEGRYADGQAQVLGISVDSFHGQAAFAKSLGLDATIMLADFEPKGAVARDYGVYLDDRGHSARATFVIDKQGIVRRAEVATTPELPDEDAVMASLTTCNA
jgi:peroxiredoxin (alkyl hydroperoxide reductase subunit C)